MKKNKRMKSSVSIHAKKIEGFLCINKHDVCLPDVVDNTLDHIDTTTWIDYRIKAFVEYFECNGKL